jgi:ribosomal protein S18 acetylase RimI-like enzyme
LPTSRLDLLKLDAATTLSLAPDGTIIGENDPDHSQGPCLFFAGCEEGNLVRVHRAIDKTLAHDLVVLAKSQPPWFDPHSDPADLEALRSLLGKDRAVETGLIWELPRRHKLAYEANIVTCNSPKGRALRDELITKGVPTHLHTAGFVSVRDLWEPWCAAMVEDQIAALAFAARLGPAGAGVGVYTFPAYRRRGLATAVTAAWTALPGLAGRALFYSTSRTNHASQQVVARLGLRRIGLRLTIG